MDEADVDRVVLVQGSERVPPRQPVRGSTARARFPSGARASAASTSAAPGAAGELRRLVDGRRDARASVVGARRRAARASPRRSGTSRRARAPGRRHDVRRRSSSSRRRAAPAGGPDRASTTARSPTSRTAFPTTFARSPPSRTLHLKVSTIVLEAAGGARRRARRARGARGALRRRSTHVGLGLLPDPRPPVPRAGRAPAPRGVAPRRRRS